MWPRIPISRLWTTKICANLTGVCVCVFRYTNQHLKSDCMCLLRGSNKRIENVEISVVVSPRMMFPTHALNKKLVFEKKKDILILS